MSYYCQAGCGKRISKSKEYCEYCQYITIENDKKRRKSNKPRRGNNEDEFYCGYSPFDESPDY